MRRPAFPLNPPLHVWSCDALSPHFPQHRPFDWAESYSKSSTSHPTDANPGRMRHTTEGPPGTGPPNHAGDPKRQAPDRFATGNRELPVHTRKNASAHYLSPAVVPAERTAHRTATRGHGASLPLLTSMCPSMSPPRPVRPAPRIRPPAASSIAHQRSSAQ